MNALSYLKALVLGIVQGATEFLPISSSGHLALVQHWFKLDPESPTLLLFDVLAHLGTLAAVVIVFWHQGTRYARRLAREMSATWSGRRYGWRFALLGVVATVPTVAIGLGFKDRFEAAFANKPLIGACLIGTGLLLAATRIAPRGRLGWRRFTFLRAAIVGVAQGIAILPGVSRSGSTICTAGLLGLRRRWAGEFSFFIALPAILGASVLKFRDTLELPSGKLAALPWGPIVLGSIVSLLVGVAALIALLQVVRRAKLHWFAPYCWVLGLLIVLDVL